ncbi:hypothetical protein OC845_002269 [Tilletia horrida]|nr:hypothetical protein OC845_002269 [Tilletia horrida]
MSKQVSSLVLSRLRAPLRMKIGARALSTKVSTEVSTIAVLGAGISGLTSALTLARNLPKDKYKIVLVEKADRIGGWVQSEVVPIRDSQAEVKSDSKERVAVLEGGPRSIRPRGHTGMVMLNLIRSLGLTPRLLSVPTFAPAARNRFLYFPDRLHRLVSSPFGLPKALLTSPPLEGAVPSVAADFFTPARSWQDDDDESVDAFLTRRFGGRAQLPSNLVSAVLHGIYAGDSRQLSVRALMPFLVRAEQTHGAVIRAVLPTWLNRRFQKPGQKELERRQLEASRLEEAKKQLGPSWEKWLRRTSVYSFPRGIQEITDAIGHELKAQPHVEMHINTDVQAVTLGPETDDAKIALTNGQTITASRVISTIPASSLATILDGSNAAAADEIHSLLRSNPLVTVAVINVVIPRSAANAAGLRDKVLPVEGFGFLIPRSTPNNEDRILGVVFDSDTFPDQDNKAAASEHAHFGDADSPSTRRFKSEKAETTKLTVMLGGHYFDKDHARSGKAGALVVPDPTELRNRALRSLERHLGIPAAALHHPDTQVIVRVQRDCIPQYVVGHVQRMKRLEALLASSPWAAGRLILTGASYTGVSLNDCVAYAERTAMAIVQDELKSTASKPITGLEMYK